MILVRSSTGVLTGVVTVDGEPLQHSIYTMQTTWRSLTVVSSSFIIDDRSQVFEGLGKIFQER